MIAEHVSVLRNTGNADERFSASLKSGLHDRVKSYPRMFAQFTALGRQLESLLAVTAETGGEKS